MSMVVNMRTAPERREKGMSEAQEAVAEVADEEWITRAQAKQLTGMSRSTLIRKEREGALTARQDGQGKTRYLVEDVVQFRRRTVVDSGAADAVSALARGERGERAAQVFELFDQGQNGADVVKTLRMDPDEVKALHDKWAQLRGRGVWVSEATMARMLRAQLAIVPKRDPEKPALETIANEAALSRAVACAVDAAAKAYQVEYGSPQEFALWLSLRWQPGEAGTLYLCRKMLGLAGETSGPEFKLAEWSSADALAQAAYDQAFQAQRLSEMNVRDLETMGDGNFEVRLVLSSSQHRTWMRVPSMALRELREMMRAPGQTSTLHRLRQLLEESEDKAEDRKRQRKSALAEKERIRREEVAERARERKEDRAMGIVD
jgi:hypothetical protein